MMTRPGGTTPGGQQPRFPGFDVLAQSDHWDEVTQSVVLARLKAPGPLRFFTAGEASTARALLDQLLDQHDEPRIPVVEVIDARLADSETDGWHYIDLPDDGEAWRVSLGGLDADAQHRHGHAFTTASRADQAAILQGIQVAGTDRWHGVPAGRLWSLWTRYALSAFYSHPWAWNEIGFSGPAYPRGYKNIGVNRREPWEVRDELGLDPTRVSR